jgi:GNAT superfamily N-acetyltransferase
MEEKKQQVELFDECTHPDHQGQGLMTELLSRATAQSGVTYLVHVYADDEKMRRFYEKRGFVAGQTEENILSMSKKVS